MVNSASLEASTQESPWLKPGECQTEKDNSLKLQWNGVCWMNPPYKDLKVWVEKAYKESLSGATV